MVWAAIAASSGIGGGSGCRGGRSQGGVGGQLVKRSFNIVGGESGDGSGCRCRNRGTLGVGGTVTEAAAITAWRSTQGR